MGMGWGCTVRTAGLLLAVTPAVVTSQERIVRACPASEEVGSLGITGIKCERCRFITEDGRERAVFFTEPVILSVRPTVPAAEHLRPGDVLMAIDGFLITTSDGWDRFSNLPADGSVVLRIRREGRVREVLVPLAGVCPSRDSGTLPALAGRPVPPPPPKAVVAEPVAAVPAPPTPERVLEAAELAPALPLPPTPSSLAPHASLGFGFQCTDCAFDGEIWDFSQPPEVQGIAPEGSVASAGLRAGDRIVAIDGVDITSEDGGRRFAEIEPGQGIVWTVERDGRRLQVKTTARERRSPLALAEPVGEAPAAAALARSVPVPVASASARPPLRFTGSVGNVTVEVRGGEVTVTEADDGRLIVIRTGDSEIRIRAPSRDGPGR
jgi:hypothetical protein